MHRKLETSSPRVVRRRSRATLLPEKSSGAPGDGADTLSTLPGRTLSPGDLRCGCHRLLARVDARGTEMACPRCKTRKVLPAATVPGDCRCATCARLLARIRDVGPELQCGRCKSRVRFPWDDLAEKRVEMARGALESALAAAQGSATGGGSGPLAEDMPDAAE